MEQQQEVWREELIPGEKILWSGRPQNVKLTDPSARGSLYLMWGIAAIWIVLSFVLYTPYAVGIGITGIQLVIVMIVFDCVPLLLIAMPLRDVSTLRDTTWYAVTDQRILAKTKERRMVMLREEGLPVKVEKSGDLSCVLFGTGVKYSPGKYRSLATMGDDEEAKMLGMMFYQIPDAEAKKVEHLLKR